MKKLLAISFVCIYLLPLIGVAKSTHYCMGNILDVEYFSFKADHCSCDTGEGTSTSCCHNTLEVFQIDGDGISSSFNIWGTSLLSQKVIPEVLEYVLLVNTNNEDSFISANLPPPRLVPVYLFTGNLQYG